MNRQSHPEIFLDLDRTIADFEYKLYIASGKRIHEVTTDEMWAIIKRYDDDDGGEFFADLPFMPDGFQLWDYVSVYNPTILTATGRDEEKAGAQKRAWCKSKLGIPDSRIITVRRSEDKALHVKPGAILIDDNLVRCLRPWIAAGGVGIHHAYARLTIAELRKYGL